MFNNFLLFEKNLRHIEICSSVISQKQLNPQTNSDSAYIIVNLVVLTFLRYFLQLHWILYTLFTQIYSKWLKHIDHYTVVNIPHNNLFSFQTNCYWNPHTLLKKFWRISLYVTDDAIAKLYVA